MRLRGGKSTPCQAVSILALLPFEPNQQAVGEHHQDRVAMKTIPASPLILVPAELGFGFFVILLDPVAPMGILDHANPCRSGRKIAPEIFPGPALPPRRTLANQPAEMTRAIAVDPVTTSGNKFRPQRPLGALAPVKRLPGPRRFALQQRIDPLPGVAARASLGHREVRPHRASKPLRKFGLSP